MCVCTIHLKKWSSHAHPAHYTADRGGGGGDEEKQKNTEITKELFPMTVLPNILGGSENQ